MSRPVVSALGYDTTRLSGAYCHFDRHCALDAMKAALDLGVTFFDTADVSCVSGQREESFRQNGKIWGVMRKSPKRGRLHPVDERINRITASLRAGVGHPFRGLLRTLVRTSATLAAG